MPYVVVDGAGKPLGAFRTKAEAQRSKASWSRELRSSGRRSVYDRLKVVKRNPSSSGHATKAQKRLNASKRSKQKRIATALRKFLKQQNPSSKLAGAKVEKLKGGVLKITPIKANPRSLFGTQAEAETFARHIGRHQKAKVVKRGNKWAVVWTKRGYQK